ncbi:MAG: hypothetical protein U0414_32795 [Polyangiaceae bacterium]
MKPPSPRSVTAIADIAAELDAALPALPAKAIIGVAPLASDVNAPRGAALATTIAAVFAGRRGLEPPSAPEALDAVRARVDGNVRSVVYLSPAIVNGEVTVTADAYPVPKTLWAQIRHPNPGPFAHAFAKAFIDAEVRSHLEPLVLGKLDASVGRNFEPNVLALACDDLDRDGAPEIVTMSAKAVTRARIRDKKVIVEAQRLWADLSARAAAPLQEPIGALAVLGGADLYGRSVIASVTDRANAVRMNALLETEESFRAMAIPDGDAFACARFPALGITGPLSACSDASPAPTRGSVGGQYDAVAAAHLVSADGKPFDVFAGREVGSLELFDSEGHVLKGANVGAQIAVGDLDQDGNPEILTSADVLYPKPDSVTIRTWDRKINVLRDVLTFPVAAGVHALAVCPPESAGRPAFVIATIDDIAVMR